MLLLLLLLVVVVVAVVGVVVAAATFASDLNKPTPHEFGSSIRVPGIPGKPQYTNVGFLSM